jgi:hypothetical protein
MSRWWLLVALFACACPAKQSTGPGAGSGGGPAIAVGARSCADVRVRVEQLYRAEAMVKESGRVAETVADNTHMAMTDCARQPDTLVPCLARAGSVAELEQHCLIPLDDEGSEGEVNAR